MKKKVFIVLLVSLFVFVTPAAAITGGQPDGEGHPYGGWILIPGVGGCSGTLIEDDLVLTAGHCTNIFTLMGISELWITFDPEAAVDNNWMPELSGTWYKSHLWFTHPDYIDANWPFTADYGLVRLDEAVTNITPAVLPSEGLLDELIGTTGQTEERFYDVGYGQNGVNVGGGPYTPNFDFIRKASKQRYHPGQGAVGTHDPMWLILGNAPSKNHGAGCPGDSGSGIFMNPDGQYGDTVVAVHTGGYRLGYEGRLCGRITSLNHRVDNLVVLDWISTYMD